VPNPRERLEILKALLQNIPHDISESDLKSVADDAHGFVGSDLGALISKSLMEFDSDSSKTVATDLRKCLLLIKPSAMREIMIQVS